MTQAEFMRKLETEGWDFTVGGLSFEALCEVYQKAYHTADYQKTNDPDNGLCRKIREFAIDRIIEILEV